jgi:DNA polymerase-3 subunit alpha
VESFQALYLKAYYPLEYMVATLNNGGGFYSAELYAHEAKMHGATLQPPCINNSVWLNTIQGTTIYLGFYLVHELETSVGTAIISGRERGGPFLHLQDFLKRVPITQEQLIILIRTDAFRFTGKSKKELLWDAHHLLGRGKMTHPAPTLFNTRVKEFTMPELWKHELEDVFDEIELLGFTTASPFDLLERPLPDTVKSANLIHAIGQRVTVVGYLVHRKRTATSTGKVMCFGTWIDSNGHWIDTVHFPPSLKRYPFSGPGCYLIKGKVVEEYDFVSIETDWMQRLKTRSLDDDAHPRLKKHNYRTIIKHIPK